MKRKFTRVSLGGVHDEAEIRGHRRTYIGAMPGTIIQAIRKAGARDCVMMLDEIDKLGRGVQGDPSSALLEVLDPAQNGTFRDNYLGVPFDLSRVVFICTANMLDTIPGPLLDRMEIIRLSGYTESEKVEIAQRHLIPRQLKENGLSPEQCFLTEAALRTLIHGYTREAGVRNLEREIGSVFRNVAVRIAEGSATSIRIDAEDIHGIFGQERFEAEIAQRATIPGVATGLAWTPVGGDILFVEASVTPGKGRLTLTGQLGDVMKESAQAAMSLVKAKQKELGLERERAGEPRHPCPCPGGRDPQGRTLGRRHHVRGADLGPDRPPGPPRSRHDRRDQPARPGHARGRHQGEGAGRHGRRHQDRDAPGPQQARLRGHPRGSAQGSGVRLARDGRAGADPCAGGEGGGGRHRLALLVPKESEPQRHRDTERAGLTRSNPATAWFPNLGLAPWARPFLRLCASVPLW